LFPPHPRGTAISFSRRRPFFPRSPSVVGDSFSYFSFPPPRRKVKGSFRARLPFFRFGPSSELVDRNGSFSTASLLSIDGLQKYFDRFTRLLPLFSPKVGVPPLAVDMRSTLQSKKFPSPFPPLFSLGGENALPWGDPSLFFDTRLSLHFSNPPPPLS